MTLAEPEEPAGSSASLRRGYLLLAVCIGLFLAHAWVFHNYVNDDAYITFRYSRFLAEGRGPYFNPGEHVEGYTNFLLMLLVSGVIKIWGAAAAAPFARTLGVVAGAATVAGTFVLATRLSRRMGQPEPWIVAGVAAGLLAACPGFAINSTSGLETTLYAALLVGGVWLADVQRDRRRWLGSGVLFAAAYLTRPEGAALFAVHWFAEAGQLLRGRERAVRRVKELLRDPRLRTLVQDGVVVTLVVGLHMLYRHHVYDGEWLPNTFYAKMGGYAGVTAWHYFDWGALHPLFELFGVAAAAVGFFLASNRGVAGPVFLTAAFGAAEPFWATPDWMPGWRLIVPYLPLAFVAAALGWAALWQRATEASRQRVPFAVLLALVPLAWIYQEPVRNTLAADANLRARGYQTGHRALAEWLDDGAANPGDQIALMDIGIIGYECPQLRILDVTGLTDRHIAKSPGGFLSKQYDPAYVYDQHPRFLVIALGVDGQAYTVPRGPLRFSPWSASERNLIMSPAFRREYQHPRPPPHDGNWLDDFAAQIGAVRIFEHAHPAIRYLLAVFERQPPSSS